MLNSNQVFRGNRRNRAKHRNGPNVPFCATWRLLQSADLLGFLHGPESGNELANQRLQPLGHLSMCVISSSIRLAHPGLMNKHRTRGETLGACRHANSRGSEAAAKPSPVSIGRARPKSTRKQFFGSRIRPWTRMEWQADGSHGPNPLTLSEETGIPMQRNDALAPRSTDRVGFLARNRRFRSR